jgi:HicA toxin of bacterial toxin-antitoxin,
MLAKNPATCYFASMNSKQKRTLLAVSSVPTPSNLAWNEIEALLVAVGCKVIEGAGSRVKFEFNGQVAFFHRHHPQKEALRYQVRDAKLLLEKLDIRP